jgi:hypothetical protein
VLSSLLVLQDENTPNRKSRPFSAADGFAGGLGAGKNPTKMKRLLGATQPARGRSQDDFQEAVAERMRPTSAADYLPQRFHASPAHCYTFFLIHMTPSLFFALLPNISLSAVACVRAGR